jgi:hypothetical protein
MTGIGASRTSAMQVMMAGLVPDQPLLPIQAAPLLAAS